ncbi:aminotransferase class I/II-fold pyridoxal phosphate-dependent enzyme [Crossiella sp. CA198]|uniref:aminotransferase class I/II-fold pyridoxal phosphate-dependent enzyme n=1 Tax=Crossiella sp. CA198 TaxID=3455607 RepID=UPI003F8D42B1
MSAALNRKLSRSRIHLTDTEFYFPTVYAGAADRTVMQNSTMTEPRHCHNFTSSNYLGLGQRPEVVEAVVEAVRRYGLGANSSPALAGHFDVHEQLCQELADLHGTPAAMLYNSGFAANLGALGALTGRGDLIVLDQAAHGSLVAGAKASGAELRYYPHRDTTALDAVLAEHARPGRTVLVGIVGVYSMAGEVENVAKIAGVARAHGAITLLDDAHGLGVIGDRGTGSLEHHGLPHDAVDIHMGTLSKTLAASGGYLAGSQELMDYLRFHAMSHLLTASIPPAVAAGCLAALRVLRAEGHVLSPRLRSRAQYFREELLGQGLDARGATAVVPVHLRTESQVIPVNELVLARGIFLSPVIFPGVPIGEGRLRFTISATHEEATLAAVAETLAECVREVDGESGRARRGDVELGV